MITLPRISVLAIALLGLVCARPAAAADVHGHALVLSGGGATGTAWETGVLLGLQQSGVDPNHADVVIGTSAGSIVGAQMRSGETLAAMLAAQKSVSPSGLATWARGVDLAYLHDTSEIYATQPITQAQRAEVGARALAAKLPDEATWLATFYPIAGIASLTAWPAAALDVVAVDAKTGAVAVFDASKADVAPLQLAVAASAAVPAFTPPITIGGRRYTDGGVAGTNIRLAMGNAVIVAIVPQKSSLVQADVDALRAAGSQVFTISPDDAALAAMGPNALDASRKPAAADAGLAQGQAAAAELRFAW
jgi:NTE family protein